MEQKYNGSQLSKDLREVKDLVPAKPVPPGFAHRGEFEGFQMAVTNAFKQGLLPESIKTQEQAIVIALKGRELGLEPLYALSVIYTVHGKPSLEGEAMLGLVLRKYPTATVNWIEMTHEKAVLELARPGGTPSRFTFTIQDAIRAGMVQKVNPDGTVVAAPRKDVWRNYTRKMLCWRAVSEGVTLLFPECIQGCLTPDELVAPEPVNIADAREIDSQFAGEPKALTAEEVVALRPEPVEVLSPTKPLLDIDPVREEPKISVPETELLPFEKPKPAKDGTYMIRFGSHMGKMLQEIPIHDLKLYLLQLQKQDERVKGADAQIKELISKISTFII